MKKNYPFKVMLLICLLCFFTACGSNEQQKKEEPKAPTQTSESTPLKKVTVAQFGHIFVYMPLYVAKQKGFFADEGLDVKFVNTGGDEKTFAALVSHSAQFGVSDPIFTAIARQRGQGGKVVASIVNGVPLWGVTKKDIPKITDPAMFSGLRIATYPAPSTTYTLMKDAIERGAKKKTPPGKIVQGAFGTLLAMLESDAADIAVVIEPAVSIAVSKGMKVVYSLPEVYGDFAFTGLMVTDEYHGKHPEMIQRMVNALVQAARYIREDIEGATEIAAKEFPQLSKQVCKNALERMVTSNTVPKTLKLSKEAWDKAVELRVRAGDLKPEPDIYEKNVDNSFVEKAEKDLH